MPADGRGSESRLQGGPAALAVPPPRLDADSPSPSPGGRNYGGNDAPSPASPSARPKDIVDSYLRQLYGGDTSTRVLAAQGLGALPSFLPRSQAPFALQLAMELGVVGSLADVLASDEELPVQESCLSALASLLLATAPHEDHAAPLRPPHLKLLGPTIVRPEVLEQMGYVLTVTTSSRVVLAAARVVAIAAPYISQSNDVHVLESRIIPALQAAIAAAPGPGERPAGGGGPGGAAATPRDAAACALALLALAEETPDLYGAVRTADVFQALAVLYQRCIDPGQPSGAVLPADAAALLLRAVTLAPQPRWAGGLPKGHTRSAERQLEECDALECLVSYVAVEAANLRTMGEQLAEAAAGNARAVVDKNGYELEHLQERQRNLQQRLAESKDAAVDCRRELVAAEEDLATALEAAAVAAGEVRAARHPAGGSAQQRRARRETEAAAAAAEEAVMARRGALAEAEEVVSDLRMELTAVRRAQGPVRWQTDRMARLEAVAGAWLDAHGSKGRSKAKVKVAKPNLPMLGQVLGYLSSRVRAPPAPERGAAAHRGAPALPPGSPSREHLAAVHAKLLAGGMVQAMVRLGSVLSSLRALAGELAALSSDLALQPDMAAALEAAGGMLGREAAALTGVNRRATLRLKQVDAEASKLRKALRLGFPRSSPLSPRRPAVALGPGNGLSREVRLADVEARLMSLEDEEYELRAVLADSELLADMMGGRLQAISAATASLTDAHTAFNKAFPAHATPSSPTKAPASPSASYHPHRPSSAFPTSPSSASPARTLALASHHIMAKDPAHPAGHLLGLLSRSLGPVVTRGSGSSNLGALVRHLYGSGATSEWVEAISGVGASGGGAGGVGAGGDAGSAFGLGFGGLLAQTSSMSVGSSVFGTPGRVAASRPASAGPSRPQSARSPGSGGGAGGTAGFGAGYPPASSPSGSRPMSARSAAASPRSPRGPGGYGASVGASGYGGGYGGHSGFSGGRLSYPTDGVGRPMRYPLDSMYGIIQATHSPLRGYSAPNNGPRFALLLRDKVWQRSAGHHSNGGGNTPTHYPLTSSPSAATASGMSVSDAEAEAALEAVLAGLPPGAGGSPLPVADESARVVQAAANSLLFDPVDVGVFGPGVLTNGSRPSTPTGGGGDSHGAGPGPAAASMCVLDALLLQSELLGAVLGGLAALQGFARSAGRACRLLPASVDWSSLEPGHLGPAMAQLHRTWAEAIARQPDMRVTVARSVAEIAELGLVPAGDFSAVYRDSGMVEALVQMLAGALRPGGGEAGANGLAAADGADEPASPSGSPPVTPGGGGGATGMQPRHVGRKTATAPPTLRLGAGQQAEQAAAARALRAVSEAQPEVLAAIGQDEQMLSRLSSLCLDHSMSWGGRLAAADLLADLLLGGGPAAAAAVAGGAYAALVEVLNRDMFPYGNQDPGGSKASVVSALAALAAHEELLEGVVAAAQAPSGPSSGLPLDSPDQVLAAILRSLWGVCQQVYASMTTDRTGHGRYVDPELVTALTSTAATAAHELALLADTSPDARRVLSSEMGLGRKISIPFLQAIKDIPLYESLLELRKNLS